jgi:hypothetical protein
MRSIVSAQRLKCTASHSSCSIRDRGLDGLDAICIDLNTVETQPLPLRFLDVF